MANIKNPQANRTALLLAAQLKLRGHELTDDKQQAIAREHGRLQAEGRYSDAVEFKFKLDDDSKVKANVRDKDVSVNAPLWLVGLYQWEEACRKFIKTEVGLVEGWQAAYKLPLRPVIMEWLELAIATETPAS
jgi:hypothetical protein